MTAGARGACDHRVDEPRRPSARPPVRRGEADVLASCYRRSLAVADDPGGRTVALPAIATGA